MTVGELHDGLKYQGFYHSHIKCNECLRTIDEIKLDLMMMFKHPDVSKIIYGWIPEETVIKTEKKWWTIKKWNWDVVDIEEGSYHLGRAIVFVFGNQYHSLHGNFEKGSIFHLAIKSKIVPHSFMERLINGITRNVSVNILHKNKSDDLKILSQLTINDGFNYIIAELSNSSQALALLNTDRFLDLYKSVSSKIPPS